MSGRTKYPAHLCPYCLIEGEVEKRLRFSHEHRTAWYGHLLYYACSWCGKKWVTDHDGSLSEDAP